MHFRLKLNGTVHWHLISDFKYKFIAAVYCPRHLHNSSGGECNTAAGQNKTGSVPFNLQEGTLLFAKRRDRELPILRMQIGIAAIMDIVID